VFTTGVCPIQKPQTGEYGWEEMKNSFPSGEIHGLTLYPASSVSNIYVSMYNHDYILLSSR
jgi:hypothetical protein